MAGKHSSETVFVAHFESFKFSQMQFGLKNGPAAFQRVMDDILALVESQRAIVHPNKIIIILKTQEQHLKHIVKLLRLLRGAAMTIKLKEYCFCKKEKLD